MVPPTIIVNGSIIPIPYAQAAQWDDSPLSLILDTGLPPSPPGPQDYRRHYLNQHGQIRVPVSQAVLDMGKLPYPGLRNIMKRDPTDKTKTVEAFSGNNAWFTGNTILSHVTVQHLDSMGMINADPASLIISSKFQVDQIAVQAILNGTTLRGVDTGIHPMFKQSNWSTTSPLMYEFLKPSLRIATEIFKMEFVLDYLHALGQPWIVEKPTSLQQGKGYNSQYSFFPRALSWSERHQTARELMRMQNFLNFEWTDDLSPGFMASTSIRLQSGWPMPGMNNWQHSHAATIQLDVDWQKLIDLGNLQPNLVLPGADSYSRLLRSQFSLALVIMHETTHAWVSNTRRTSSWDSEPYHNDHRIAEPGWALEALIFGSPILSTIQNPIMYDSPYGLSSIRFPGTRGSYTDFCVESYKGTVAKWGIEHHTEYAVPMSFITQFFDDDFYNNRAQRFGATGALKPPKVLGVRKRIWSHYEVPLESPHVKRRKVGNTWVEDPEQPSPTDDTLHPAIADGVLYENAAYDLQGNTLVAPPLPTPPPPPHITPFANPILPTDVAMPDDPDFARATEVQPQPPGRATKTDRLRQKAARAKTEAKLKIGSVVKDLFWRTKK
ncbi:hypothetical protein E4T39_04627 [Aureobasidium subglaciale]|nr:hypothetical protein E4T39_04627 [Aureobasidium subglaciale]